jgi:hypothetical protein
MRVRVQKMLDPTCCCIKIYLLFEKNLSMLFFAMIFCFVFTTMLITIKISYLFFTWKHFQFLEARGFYAMRNLTKRLRKKQVYELCYSLDLLLSLMYMFSPFFRSPSSFSLF